MAVMASPTNAPKFGMVRMMVAPLPSNFLSFATGVPAKTLITTCSRRMALLISLATFLSSCGLTAKIKMREDLTSSTLLKEVLDTLYKYFPKAPLPELQLNSLYLHKGQKGLYLDTKKIQTCLKWSCKYNVEDALKEMFSHVRVT